jgi:CDP-glycerol glycerophosphotransferase (TagB/SpsB family)
MYHNKSKLDFIIKNCKMLFSSLRWKKDPTIVLVGAWLGDKYADNSRFLFEYLSDNKSDLGLTRVVWVSRSEEVVKQVRSMGYEAYLIGTEESDYYHQVAKYHIICNLYNHFGTYNPDIDVIYSWRAIKVNLWHGVIGFKGVGNADRNYLEYKRTHRLQVFIKDFLHNFSFYRKIFEFYGGWGDCYYLTTSPLRSDIMTSFFKLPRSHYIETGFPRVSGTVHLLPEEEKVIDLIISYDKTIIYLPTFRKTGSAFDFNEACSGMERYLADNDVLWIQKSHSASSEKTEELFLKGNTLTLPHSFDINSIIPYISLMITDYSSAAGDAMYYYKPIVFYVPDFEDYKNSDRGFPRDPDEIMCGPKAKTVKELKICVDDLLSGEFIPDEKYISVRNEYYAHSKNMAEIWQDILKRVGK